MYKIYVMVVCVCVSRVSNSGLLAVWCPQEGIAEPLTAKHGEQRRKGSEASSSEFTCFTLFKNIKLSTLYLIMDKGHLMDFQPLKRKYTLD